MRKLCLLLFACSSWGATFTCTAVAGSSNWSAPASWTTCNSTYPDNGHNDGNVYIAVVGASSTVTADISVSVGSNAAGVGDGISVSGTLKENSGVNLTLAGFQLTSNRMMVINSGGSFIPSPGATITFNLASDNQSRFENFGTVTSVGTALNPINWTSNGATWNNVKGATVVTNILWNAGSTPSTYYDGTTLYAYAFPDSPLANSGGTALGSSADTSVAFSSITCSPTCTGGNLPLQTIVASKAAVVSVGQYYIDHANGIVYFRMAATGSTMTFTYNYDYLKFNSGSIHSTSGSNNPITFQHNNVTYLGSTGGAGYAVQLGGKTTGGTNTAIVTDNTFTYVKDAIGISVASNGSAGNLILLDRNTIQAFPDSSNVGAITIGDTSSYIDISDNVISGKVNAILVSSGKTLTNSVIQRNVVDNQSMKLVYTVGDVDGTSPGVTITGNVVRGSGAATFAGDRTIACPGGTSGNHATVSNNIMLRGFRAGGLRSYTDVAGNWWGAFPHHGLILGTNNQDTFITGVTYTNNVCQNMATATCMDYGYNLRNQIDTISATNNTMTGSAGIGAFTWSDILDTLGPNIMTHASFSDNLVTANQVGISRKISSSATLSSVLHVVTDDGNDVFNNTTQYSNDWSRFSTFSGITNVAGVSLYNPSVAGPISGKTLALVFTSATNITLSWDGGAAVQIVQDSGTASAATSTTISDSTKTWSANQTLAAYAGARWIWITSGTGSGQMRVATNVVSGTQLTIAPAWTVTPDATSHYSIVKIEATLAGTGSTVEAGIYLPSLPQSNQTDSAVGFSTTTVAVDPRYTDTTRTFSTWDAALGGTGTEDGAWARLQANTSLIAPLLAYLQGGVRPQNPAIWCGVDTSGVSTGAVNMCKLGPAILSAQ